MNNVNYVMFGILFLNSLNFSQSNWWSFIWTCCPPSELIFNIIKSDENLDCSDFGGRIFVSDPSRYNLNKLHHRECEIRICNDGSKSLNHCGKGSCKFFYICGCEGGCLLGSNPILEFKRRYGHRIKNVTMLV